MTTATGLQFLPKETKDRKNLRIKSGDTVRVYTKIQEKGKTRLQPFEGLVLSVKHGHEPGARFTVRKVSSGVGIERIFPLYSPVIDTIEVIKRAQVRRSKLYYIRNKVTRDIRRKMRHFQNYFFSTEQLEKEQEQALAKEPDVAEDEESQTGETAREEQSTEATSSEERSTEETDDTNGQQKENTAEESNGVNDESSNEEQTASEEGEASSETKEEEKTEESAQQDEAIEGNKENS